ncbi:MAG TPA: hypothetical protein VIX90_16095 [Edaphobacter sp.]
MSTHLSTLNLVKRDRHVSGPGVRSGRSFLDFVIDGLSLYDEIGWRSDLISTLWVSPPVPEEQQKAVRRLLGLEQGDLPGDRVSLYVCPECGDVGCGAITLKVEFAADEVIWSDFGYENNYEESIDRVSYGSMGPFRFSRQAYEELMSLL